MSTKIWLFSPHVYNYIILISRTLQNSTSCHDSFCSYSSKGIPDRHFSSHSNFLLQIDSLECFITATASFCCFLFTASQVTLQCCWLPVVAVSAAWSKPWSRAALLLPGDATGLDGCESDYGMIEKHDDTKLEDKDQNIQVAAFSSCKCNIFVCIPFVCPQCRKSRLAFSWNRSLWRGVVFDVWTMDGMDRKVPQNYTTPT